MPRFSNFGADEKQAIRKIAYHEAAHAVLYWDLGFGVRRVMVNPARGCGHAQALRNPKDRTSRIARAVTCVGGLAAHSYLEPKLEWRDVSRSLSDLRQALGYFLPVGEFTAGEEFWIAISLTQRVAGLLGSVELRRQIESLLPPLLATGYLFECQVEKRLRGLTESRAARAQCRAFVAQLEGDRADLVEKARGEYPEFSWP